MERLIVTPQDIQRIAAELQALNSQYWYEVDRHEGAVAHLFFVEDGVFVTSQKKRSGRAAIAEFYGDRKARPLPRTARHVITNTHVRAQDVNNATVDWILLLYAADGAPVLPSEPAIMIADVHDVCRRESDGRWLYVSRYISAVFRSNSPTTS